MSSDATPDPLLAAPLAKAERRLALLEELTDIGMNFARQMDAHAAAAMADVLEKKDGNPSRPFATLSRAIRLNIAMEARVDAMILALRKGKLPRGWTIGPAIPAHAARLSREAESREAGESLREEREDLYDRETFGAFERRAPAVLAKSEIDPNPSGLAPHPPEEAGEGDHEAVVGAASDGIVVSSHWRPSSEPFVGVAASSTPSGSLSPVVACATGEEWNLSAQAQSGAVSRSALSAAAFGTELRKQE